MDLLVFLGILIFGSATVTIAIIRGHDTRLPALAAVSLTAFVRVMPNAPPTMHWWRDPHFYLIPTLGLVETGRLPLSPEFLSWYPQSSRQLTWLVMHFVTASLIQVTGIDFEAVIRFVSALWGPIILVCLWALYTRFLETEWALLAAYLTSMLDLIVFYQMEYHAQGVGLIFVVLLLYYLSTDERKFSGYPGLAVLVGILIGAAYAHHFTATVVLIFLGLYGITQAVPHLRQRSNPPVALTLLLFGILMAIPHLFIEESVISSGILGILGAFSPPGAAESGGVERVGATIVDRFPVLIKGVLAAGSLPAIWLTLRHKPEHRPLVVYLACTGLIAVIVAPIAFGLMNRIILFGYIPLVGLFVLTLWRIAEVEQSLPLGYAVRACGIVIVVSGLVVASALVGYPPSMVDPSSDVRADGFHGIEPIGEQGPAAGEWVNLHSTADTTFYTHLHTYVIPFYYGEFSTHNVEFARLYEGQGSLLVDEERVEELQGEEVIYSNGRIIITESN